MAMIMPNSSTGTSSPRQASARPAQRASADVAMASSSSTINRVRLASGPRWR